VLGDVKLAVRTLSRARGTTAVVLASLALGIGANTALFGTVDALWLRTLPVEDPDGLVRLRAAGPNAMRTDVLVYGSAAPDARGRPIDTTFSYPMYQELAAANRTLADLFACAPIGRANVVVGDRAEIATAFLASGNYHRALGVLARVGRTITPEDDRPAAPPVAVISHRYWMTRFGGDLGVVGASARVNDTPVTIVGVLPPGFTGVERAVDEAPDVSMPLSLEPRVTLPRSSIQASLLAAPNFWWLHVMGRLKPGATAAQVEGKLAGVFAAAARAGMDAFLATRSETERKHFAPRDPTAVPELLVDSGRRGLYDVDHADARAVAVEGAMAVLVLLIVCANVATLQLSRATARRTELSVRRALGATRTGLVRHLLTESLLLSGAGGVLGIVVARAVQAVVAQTEGAPSPLDLRVLGFGLGLSAATGVLCGLVPALRATRADVVAALKRDARAAAPALTPLARSLVVAQVTISLVLLAGAFLFVRTVRNLRDADVGFAPENVLLFGVDPSLNRYDRKKQAALYEEIGRRLGSIGGVRSVAWSDPPLLSSRVHLGDVYFEDRPYPHGSGDGIQTVFVSPSFFAAMGIRLLAGRAFTEGDVRDAPLVAAVNHAAARAFFGDASPLGRRLGWSRDNADRIEIVAVVGDVRGRDARAAAPPMLYTPWRQSADASAVFAVRTAGDPRAALPAVRAGVGAADPSVPLMNVTTLGEEVEDTFRQERLFARHCALAGSVALLVAAVGLFGLVSYGVARRTNEIGIRMALGAVRRDVLALVMRESMALVATGVLLGLAAIAAGSRVLASLLFGVVPADASALAGASVLVAAVSAAAAYLPARRAARVDPLAALRYE
jgi:predicted permease